jgi:hypothetical protein
MTVNSLSWFRAAQLLGIPEAERSKGWHDCFSAHELALMQAPEDKEEQKVMRGAIETSLKSSTSRNPEDRDIDREPYIYNETVMAAKLYPDLNSPQIKLYSANTISDWLKNNNESPSPFLVSWFKAMRIDSFRSVTVERLEPLADEQKQGYNSRTAWTWVDAIYILQGYKPVHQLSTEQVRSHFPQQVHDFTRSIQLGTIGKEIIEAGEKTFIDSPANWQAYWQGISKQTEPVASVGEENKEDEHLTLRPGIYGQRDLDAAEWYKTKEPEDVEKMTNPQIENALKTRNRPLWNTGFDDWNREQTVWPKKSPGRKRGK